MPTIPSVRIIKIILLLFLLASGISNNSVHGITNASNQISATQKSDNHALLSNKSPAKPATINIYYEKHTQHPLEFIQRLSQQIRKELPQNPIKLINIDQLTINEIKKQIPKQSNCAVSIGLQTTQKILSIRASSNIFSLNLSRLQLDKLHRIYQKLGIFVTGIYQEQTFARQINLSKALSPELDSISILLNQADKFDLPFYQQAAQQADLKLRYKILQASDTADKYLASISTKNSFLLISNNHYLYHKTKLASLILSAYHQQVNLIGSQLEDTVVGTLASVYTPQEELIQQAGYEIKQLCLQQMQPPHYADQFAVKINQQIAANLKPQLTNDSLQQVNQRLTRQLKEMEQYRLKETTNE